jgi:hypothetical protein
MSLFGLLKSELACCAIVRGNPRQFKPNRTGAAYDFRMRSQSAGAAAWISTFSKEAAQKKTRAQREPALLLEISRYRPLTRSADRAD